MPKLASTLVPFLIVATACSAAPGDDATGTTSQAYEAIAGYGSPAIYTVPAIDDVDNDGSQNLCQKGETCLLADVNGDGADDLVDFRHAGPSAPGDTTVVVGVSAGQQGPPYGNFDGPGSGTWSHFFCKSSESCAVGDVNGDHKADIIAFARGSSPLVWVSLSDGSSFGPPSVWHDFFCLDSETCKLADMNGDGRADLVTFTQGSNPRVWVALSNGASFGAAAEWSPFFCVQGSETCDVGDLNADGRADVLAFDANTKLVWVSLSTGSALGPPSPWGSIDCYNGGEGVCEVTDADGDGRADVVQFTHTATNPQVFVGFSYGSGLSSPQLEDGYFCLNVETCLVGHQYRPSIAAISQNPPPSPQDLDTAIWIARPLSVIR